MVDDDLRSLVNGVLRRAVASAARERGSEAEIKTGTDAILSAIQRPPAERRATERQSAIELVDELTAQGTPRRNIVALAARRVARNDPLGRPIETIERWIRRLQKKRTLSEK